MTVGADPGYVDPTAGFDPRIAPDGAGAVPVGTPSPFDLFGIAKALLTHVVDGFTARDIAVPTLQYVGGGMSAAYDGEQVTVNAQRITPGKPDLGAAGMPAGFMEQSATFAVAVVRPFPMDVTPDPAAIEAASMVNANDLAVLWSILVELRSKATWPLAQDGAPVPFTITECRGEGPQGGVVAAVGIVSVTIV